MDALFTPENERLAREMMKSKHIKTSTRLAAGGLYLVMRVCNFIDWLFPV
jgi:hypothetical protein